MAFCDGNSDKSYILSLLNGGRAHIHFVGILGAGMAPLAMLLRDLGLTVSGTDLLDGARACELRRKGISVVSEHTSLGLDGVALVVFTLAVPEDTPELVYARAHNIPTVTRAEFLGAILSRYFRSLTVSGTHGKSTTVAMLDCITSAAGLRPTVISGATLTDGSSLRLGASDLAIAEACEYRRAFLHLNPSLALVTNVELDHTDCYPTERDMYEAYLCFLRSSGTAILNIDCPLSRRLAGEDGITAYTYGTGEADVRLIYHELHAESTYMLVSIEGEVYDFTLSVTGRGNLYDALAAIAAAVRLGISPATIRDGLAAFCGIGRRLEAIGELDGRAVYYDYAHHPTEIENTLTTLGMRHGRVSVVFRPHTYSRTASFMDDFARVLRMAADAVILDIYPAREAPIPGVTSAALAERIGKSAVHLDGEKALDYLLSREPSAIVLLGAGEMDGILNKIKK